MKTSIITFLALISELCLALEPTAVTNAAQDIVENVLGAEHSCFEFMKGTVQRNEWTPEDCSEILLLAEQLLRGSTNQFDIYRRKNAITLLGQMGEANALPTLLELMRSEQDEEWKSRFGESFLQIGLLHPNQLVALKEEIARNSAKGGSFPRNIYDRANFILKYDVLPVARHKNLLRFLLDQTAVEQGERAMLDEILCREVPKWRASPQRLANAEKMIREHSDDAGAVAFFESVKADVLSAAETARRQNPDDGTPDSPTNAQNQNADTPANDADPWASLLDNLPKKKPWTPPDGSVPAS